MGEREGCHSGGAQGPYRVSVGVPQDPPRLRFLCEDSDGDSKFDNYGSLPEDGVRALHLNVTEEGITDATSHELYIQTVAGLKGVQRILDVSCGLCGGLMALEDVFSGAHLTGLDAQEEAIESCRAVPWKEFGIDSSKIELHVRDIRDALPFNDGAFDLLVSVETIQEYPPNWLRLWMKEAHRVVRPGGHIAMAFFCDSGSGGDWGTGHIPAIPLARGLTGSFNHRCRDLVEWLEASGFVVKKRSDITANVTRALRARVQETKQWHETRMDSDAYPWNVTLLYSALPGSPMFDYFEQGVQKFWILQAKKPLRSPWAPLWDRFLGVRDAMRRACRWLGTRVMDPGREL